MVRLVVGNVSQSKPVPLQSYRDREQQRHALLADYTIKVKDKQERERRSGRLDGHKRDELYFAANTDAIRTDGQQEPKRKSKLLGLKYVNNLKLPSMHKN